MTTEAVPGAVSLLSRDRMCPMFRSQYGDSECGSSQGFGSCDKGSGSCTCHMGFEGRNCSQIVCCHMGLVIGLSCAVVLAGAICTYFLWRRSLHGSAAELKKTVVKPFPSGDVEVGAAPSLTTTAAEGGLRYSASSPVAATQQARRPSVGGSSAAPQPSMNTSSQPSTPQVSAPGLGEEHWEDASSGLGTWARAATPSPTDTKPGAAASPSAKATAPRHGSKQRMSFAERRSSTASATAPRKSNTLPTGGTGERERRSSEARPASADQRRGSAEVPPKAVPERRTSVRSSEGAEDRRQSARSSEVPQAPLERRPSVRSSGDLPTTAESLKKYLDGLVAEPLLVRKQMFKELLLEYHPDKNDSPNAKDLFHVVNSARPWFLKEN